MVTPLDIISVFATPFGIAAFLIGLVLFFAIPLLAAVTPFKWPSKMMFALATAPLSRAAVVISESNDAVFKAMSFVEPGVEAISLGDEEKTFSDPDGALSWWRGVRFALANEADGVLFDPRHAAIGKAKAEYDEAEDAEYRGTEQDWDTWGIVEWKPAVFELASRPVLQNLSHVRELVDGGERAEYPQRVESFYKHSRNPFQSGGIATKFMYPILGFCVPFFGIWILASQLGTPGGRPGSSVSFGMVGLIMTLPTPDRERAADIAVRILRVLLGLLLFVAIPAGGFYLLWTAVSPVAAIGLYVAFFAGFGLLPLFSVFVRFSQTLSAAFANLFLKLGFLGYRAPVYVWRPDGYQLMEADALGDVRVDCWYGLFGSKVGFAYDPDANPWRESETLSPGKVRAHARSTEETPDEIPTVGATNGDGVAVADGGSNASNLPAAYRPAPNIKRDGMGGFVPKAADVDDDRVYVSSFNALGRFRNSADGSKSMERLLLAKEKWGGDNSALSDKAVLYATLGTTVLGGLLGVFFFIA